jgi:hypothetical protein
VSTAPLPAPASSDGDVLLWVGLGAAVLVIAFLLYMKEEQAAGVVAATSALPSSASGPTAAQVSQVAAESAQNANSTTSTVTAAESTAVSVASDAATGNIAGAAAAAVSGIITQITQHSARLQGATAENTAADEVVPAFDADLQATNAAYLAGEITLAQAQTALNTILQNCYNSLYALVGKPGTAWSGSASAASAGNVPCTKACTVSCCIYWNDLYCAINGCKQFANGTVGAQQALLGQGTGSGGPYESYVPEVYPPDDSAYGTFTRASYTLLWTPPASTPASVAQHLL